MPPNYRELLLADLALTQAHAPAAVVAQALQRFWESDGAGTVAAALEKAGALDPKDRQRLERQVETLIAEADGDAAVALARRGGIDRSIHTSLRPETSRALLKTGAGARAPLRSIPEGRYTDFSVVGKGGMGVVYLTLDTELNRRVAFKMVMPDPKATKDTPAPTTPLEATPPSESIAADEDNIRSFEELKVRFLQEAWVTGAMEHPGVVPVYELGQTDLGIPYYTMRYVKGDTTLADAMKATTDVDSRLALLEPFLKMCDTIRYAHARGVVHRDLKPANIALGEFGEVIVLDWGLSKMQGKPDIHASMWRARIAEFREAADLSTVAGVMGTPGYMAPEAALGKGDEVDGASDVYSLGAILFEMLAKRLPFQFGTYLEYVQRILEQKPPFLADVAPGVPRELAHICAKALAKEKEERFRSVDEFAQEVRRWQTEGRLALQIEALMEDATQELEAARKLSGNMMLWHLDRASADCTKVLHLRQDHAEAQQMLGDVKRLREGGIRERVRSDRRRALVGAGFAILAVAAVATLWVAKVLRDEREAAQADVLFERRKTLESLEAAERAEARAAAASARLAEAFSGAAVASLKEGRVAAARLLAARGVAMARTPVTWAALARAEARWAPTLRGSWPKLAARSFAFARDGRHVYAGGADGTIRVLDLATGEVARELKGHETAVVTLAVSGDGATLASGSKAGRIKTWDATTGGFRRDIPRRLAPRGDDATTVSHEVKTGTPVRVIRFGADGTRLYAAYADGAVRHWNVEDGGFAGGMIGMGFVTRTLTLGPGGRTLYGGTGSGVVMWWPLTGGGAGGTAATNDGAIDQVLVGADGEHFYAASVDNRIVLWDDDTQTTEFEGPAGRSSAVLFTRDRRHFVAVAEDSGLQIWDIPAGRLLVRIDEFASPVVAVRLSDDGSLFAAGHADGTARVWDLKERWRPGDDDPAAASAVSADARTSFLARPDHAIDVWDAKEGRVVDRLSGHRAVVTALAAEGERLVSASLDGTFRVWTTGEDDGAVVVRGVETPATAIALTGGEIVAGTLTGEIQRWDWRRKRRIPYESDEGAPVSAVAVAAGAARVAAGDLAGRVRVRPLDGTDETFPTFEESAAVAAVALSPDGERAAAALDDGRLYLWPVRDPGARRRVGLPGALRPVRLEVRDDGTVAWAHPSLRGGRLRRDGAVEEHTFAGTAARLAGSPQAWILKDDVRRLVHAEDRSGLMLDQFEVLPVPAATYDPRRPRVAPWSR